MPEPKPKPSIAQQVMDGVSGLFGGPIGGPALADYLTSKLLFDEDDEHHPKSERKGSIENLIKGFGLRHGTLVSPDLKYLEQYLHPNSDVLPRTKPPGFKSGTIPYREPSYEGGAANTEGLGRFAYVDPASGQFSPAVNDGDRPVGNRDPGMSHIFDVWDFDTPAGMLKDGMPTTRGAGDDALENNLGSEIAKRILRASGSPYAVYGPEKK